MLLLSLAIWIGHHTMWVGGCAAAHDKVVNIPTLGHSYSTLVYDYFLLQYLRKPNMGYPSHYLTSQGEGGTGHFTGCSSM